MTPRTAKFNGLTPYERDSLPDLGARKFRAPAAPVTHGEKQEKDFGLPPAILTRRSPAARGCHKT